MRIYEYAKKHNVSSKRLLAMLADGGFEFKTHMAALSPESLDFLNKKLGISKDVSEPKKKEDKMPLKQPKRRKAEQLKKRDVVVEKEVKALRQAQDERSKEVCVTQKIVVRPMSLTQLSEEMCKPATGVILTLLKWGVVCTKNQVLPEDLVSRLAEHYEIETEAVSAKKEPEELKKEAAPKGAKLQDRYPVVVVMGHVDHGKTTLLDFIRKARVAAKEKGGITQHLGAYEVELPQGGIVFLDTPGHEAFSKIRMRGAHAADIAVLVIAADDGIMPQTVEAINHAKAMEVPIVVAINKMDRVDSSRIEAVKQGLTKHDLLPEDWGGDVVCVPISAKLGQGIDHLLDMIILQSQLMELKADKDVPARGYVLESKQEKGLGPVATLICQHGVAKIGDFFICGETFGKITSLVSSAGKRVQSVAPSIPAQVSGFDSLPEAGDFFEVVSPQQYRKARLGKIERKPTMSRLLVAGAKKDINIIVKADSDSSKEALLMSIEKISKKLDRGFNVVHSAVGNISESDIDLAAISESVIVGLHIKPEAKAASVAQKLGVDIKLFDIIYKLVEYLQELSESKKETKKEIKKVGEAVVLRVFKIKNVGVIAGCLVRDGVFSRGAKIVALRGGKKIGEGKITSLQREKKTVKEAHAGFECGFIVEGFDDWEVDDTVECYQEVAEKK